jgi:hypothetical protein
MGIEDQGSFANDGAMDWLAELAADGTGALSKALRLSDGYVSIDEAQHAIAAAEIIAAIRGEIAEELPKAVHSWLMENADVVVADEDVASAINAVVRVRDNSELQEVWSEGPRYELWLRETAELLRRLEAVRGRRASPTGL